MATVATKHKPLTITVELTAEQREVFQRAADIQGRTLEEFIVAVAETKAEEILYGRFDVGIKVSPEAYARFLEVLDDPGEPNEHLRSAFARHRDMFGE